jgi:hypothetical protein
MKYKLYNTSIFFSVTIYQNFGEQHAFIFETWSVAFQLTDAQKSY